MNLFSTHRKTSKNKTFRDDPGRFSEPGPLEKLNKVFELNKIKVAAKLTAWSEGMSVTTRKIILIGLGAVVSAMSLSLFLSPFSKLPSRKTTITPIEMHGIMVFPLAGAAAISQEDFDKMSGFLKILDSLKIHDRATYQMLIEGRQGLVDSIEFLIHYRDHR